MTLKPLKNKNSISFDKLSKSRDDSMTLLESKADCLEYYETVSLGDIIKTYPKIENLMVYT